MQKKLDAIADGLSALMERLAEKEPKKDDLRRDVEDLKAAVGLEERT